MFEGSVWELALIFVLALVVFGPERLPGLARTVGLWVGRARAILGRLTEQIEQELAIDDMRKTLATARRTVREPLGGGETRPGGEPGVTQEPVKYDPPRAG